MSAPTFIVADNVIARVCARIHCPSFQIASIMRTQTLSFGASGNLSRDGFTMGTTSIAYGPDVILNIAPARHTIEVNALTGQDAIRIVDISRDLSGAGAPGTDRVATSRAIVDYCAKIALPDITTTTIIAQQIAITNPVACPLNITASCTLASFLEHPRASCSRVDLPPARDAPGQVREVIPHPGYIIPVSIDGGNSVLCTVIDRAAVLISNGAQWFAIDTFGRKFAT